MELEFQPEIAIVFMTAGELFSETFPA